MTAAQTYSEFGAALAGQALDAQVVHHARRAIVDWWAALLPGAVESPPVLLERALHEDLDRGGARLALGRPATVRAAALINATAAHTVEVDDIFRDAIYHPGAPTIAAALALAQARGAGGLQMIRGVVAGYEISTRIGVALGREHYRFWHNTGTVGTFGAAAAAATLLRLEPSRYAHALSTAATFAAGLQQAFRKDSMSKPLHAGHAADAGVLAALAAESGVTGSVDVLDGDAGLGRAMSGAPDWARATAGLGEVFNIGRMTFKNHACCGHAFAAIDGVLQLQARMGLAWQDIAAVEIHTYRPALDVAGNPDPRTAPEARFSLPYVVAHALVHGSVRLAAFTPVRLADAGLRELMARVTLAVDPALDAVFPSQRAARVVIHARDGRRESFLQPTRKGDPDLPLSDDDLSHKFMELAGPVVGAARAGALLATLWRLDECDDLTPLCSAGALS